TSLLSTHTTNRSSTNTIRRPPHAIITPLFLQDPPPHRDLHSFPTRRSSDLLRPDLFTNQNVRKADNAVLLCRLADAMLEGRRGRSEEHTSELQSLAYLVCRLLLEKKKSLFDWHSCESAACIILVSLSSVRSR